MALDYVSLSKTVSHALRHAPWMYELELDEEGWTDIDPLLERLRLQREDWRDLSEADLQEMISRSDKQRHEIRHGRIRSLYGHSIPGRLQKTRAWPPEILYHGTSPSIARRIMAEGLRPMRRQYVHLSRDVPTAVEVGKRKASRPVILQVSAGKAADAGIAFYEGNDRVWLADQVPPGYIQVLRPEGRNG